MLLLNVPDIWDWIRFYHDLVVFIRQNSLKQKLSILDALRTYILKNGDFAALLNEDDLQTVISIWCTIYLASLRNLKLCQKVRKVKWFRSSYYPGILCFLSFFTWSWTAKWQQLISQVVERHAMHHLCIIHDTIHLPIMIVPNFSCQWVLQSLKDNQIEYNAYTSF